VTSNCPTGYHNHFSQDFGVELPSTLDEHVLGGQGSIPADINRYPMPFAERTFKEKMQQSLFCIS
jgi:hypothetical protein